MLCTQAVDILLCFLDSAIGWASSIGTPVKMKGESITTRFHFNGYRTSHTLHYMKIELKYKSNYFHYLELVCIGSVLATYLHPSQKVLSMEAVLLPYVLHISKKQQSSDHRKLWLCFQWATCSWLTYFDAFERQVLAELPYVLLQVKHYHTML